MKLTRIHRVVEFAQSRWMAKYIEFNTSMRTKAKTDFEKDFFKLMNNSSAWSTKVLSASTSGFGFFIPLERSRRALQGYANRLVIRAKLRPLLAMQKGSICTMSSFWRAQRCYVDRTFVLSDISSNICSYEAQRCYVHYGVDIA
jgi:hypothetical protein